MFMLTVIDDGVEQKTLEIRDESNAIKIQMCLVENGCMVKRDRVD